MVFVAIYDSEKLVGVDVASKALPAANFTYYNERGTVDLTALRSISGLDGGDYNIKAYIWSPSLNPHIKAIEADLDNN